MRRREGGRERKRVVARSIASRLGRQAGRRGARQERETGCRRARRFREPTYLTYPKVPKPRSSRSTQRALGVSFLVVFVEMIRETS